MSVFKSLESERAFQAKRPQDKPFKKKEYDLTSTIIKVKNILPAWPVLQIRMSSSHVHGSSSIEPKTLSKALQYSITCCMSSLMCSACRKGLIGLSLRSFESMALTHRFKVSLRMTASAGPNFLINWSSKSVGLPKTFVLCSCAMSQSRVATLFVIVKPSIKGI